MSDHETPPDDKADNKTGEAGPEPRWREDGALVSDRFGDVYFSRDGGLDETRHVFLKGCGLPERWQSRDRFTIAETGFGTGLNMLATWQAFRDSPGQCRQLNLISVEAYPLTRSDMTRALDEWPELGDLRAGLLAQYPPPEPGVHRLVFDGGRVCLTLLIGEAAAMFGQLRARVDAWFLDGFSPSKNPEMWREEVMDQVARLSAPDAVAASFTVARAVRDRLSARGFACNKAPGFGRKRDMLVAHREVLIRPEPLPDRRFAIIGAGIAGSAMAAALAARGQAVTVIDPHPGLERAASGNPVGIVMPRLHLGDDPVSDFNRSAWRFATAWYDRLPPVDGAPALTDCGVLQLARDADEAARFQRLARLPNVASRSGTVVDGEQVHFLTGTRNEHGGLWLPEAGWVRPHRLCQALRQHEAITVVDKAVARIRPSDSGWDLFDATGEVILSADVVIVANGLDSRLYPQLDWQPLRPKRGQITELVAEAGHGPNCITTFGHYLSPVIDGRRIVGASYDRWDDAIPANWPDVRDDSDDGNRAALAAAMPALAGMLRHVIGSRAALRATTPDHLPLAGSAPDPEDIAAVLPGLYLLTGLGSTGLVTAPICAETICASLFDEPLSMADTTAAAIAPARFLERAAKRGQVTV